MRCIAVAGGNSYGVSKFDSTSYGSVGSGRILQRIREDTELLEEKTKKIKKKKDDKVNAF